MENELKVGDVVILTTGASSSPKMAIEYIPQYEDDNIPVVWYNSDNRHFVRDKFPRQCLRKVTS